MCVYLQWAASDQAFSKLLMCLQQVQQGHIGDKLLDIEKNGFVQYALEWYKHFLKTTNSEIPVDFNFNFRLRHDRYKAVTESLGARERYFWVPYWHLEG